MEPCLCPAAGHIPTASILLQVPSASWVVSAGILQRSWWCRAPLLWDVHAAAWSPRASRGKALAHLPSEGLLGEVGTWQSGLLDEWTQMDVRPGLLPVGPCLLSKAPWQQQPLRVVTVPCHGWTSPAGMRLWLCRVVRRIPQSMSAAANASQITDILLVSWLCPGIAAHFPSMTPFPPCHPLNSCLCSHLQGSSFLNPFS